MRRVLVEPEPTDGVLLSARRRWLHGGSFGISDTPEAQADHRHWTQDYLYDHDRGFRCVDPGFTARTVSR